LGSIPAGETRRISIVVQSEASGDMYFRARLTSSNDMNPGNDERSVSVQFAPSVDVALQVDDYDTEGMVGDALRSRFTVSASGVTAGEQVVFRGRFAASLIQSVTADAGTCTIRENVPICRLGTVLVGEPRQVTVIYSPTTAEYLEHSVWVTSLHDDVPYNEQGRFGLHVSPRHGLTLYTDDYWSRATIGESFTRTAQVRTTGPQPLENTTVRIDFDAGTEIISITAAAGVCTPMRDVRAWKCLLPLLDADSTSPIQIVARTTAVGRHSIGLKASSPDNDYPAAGRAWMTIDTSHPFDMQIHRPYVNAYAHLDHTFDVGAQSNSLNDETKVRVRIAIPDGIVIKSAVPSRSSCTISGNTITCAFGTVRGPEGGVVVRVTVHSAVAGQFTGTATVLSANDADPANNTIAFPINVASNLDAAVEAPDSRAMVEGRVYTLRASVRSGPERLPNPILSLWPLPDQVAVESAEMPEGPCEIRDGVYCYLDPIPRESATAVTFRIRALEAGSAVLRFRVSVRDDHNSANDYAYTGLNIDPAP
jgi:hypothetical protein